MKTVIEMAREANIKQAIETPHLLMVNELERFAELVRADERNTLAAWMIQFGFATDHGDTMEELVDALGSEIVDRIECEIDTEREACAKVADDQWVRNPNVSGGDAIKARSNT